MAVLFMDHSVGVDVDVAFCVNLEIASIGIRVEVGPFTQ